MNYALWGIVIIAVTVAVIIMQIVYRVISRKRAEKLGILYVKRVIFRESAWLTVIVVMIAVFAAILAAVDMPRAAADIAEYGALLDENPELYGNFVEKAGNRLGQDRFMLTYGIVVTVLELFTLFGGGAYVTKEGVMYFDGMKPVKTAAKLVNGSINFYIVNKRERYAFDLPDTSENRELFSSFIQQNV